MSIAIVTGASGLVGCQTVRHFAEQGLQVIGIDNDMRRYFFGPEASTRWSRERLEREVRNYTHHDLDIRDGEGLQSIFATYGKNIAVIVHTAAQPSHDWAATDPMTDFQVNAVGTLNLLNLTRRYSPEAVFIFTSTNKIYGDRPNTLPLLELKTRWEVTEGHAYYERGIDESMSIDASLHSIFGVSKASADLLVQEYGRYFGMNTVVFRGGCLTGPNHSGAALHGFLAYLMKCTVEGRRYEIQGYKGKQVRDNIHSADLVAAFWEYFKTPRRGAVYNMGGGRLRSCSILEAIDFCQEISGRKLNYVLHDDSRIGDHIWWITDTSRFECDFPQWGRKVSLIQTLGEIYEALIERTTV